MPVIRFVDQHKQTLATVACEAGDNLLDVARFHEVPLHWRCGQGTCGTCKVQRLDDGAHQACKVGRKERNVLLREKLIDPALATSEDWPDQYQRWRLACHLTVGDEDWMVLCQQD